MENTPLETLEQLEQRSKPYHIQSQPKNMPTCRPSKKKYYFNSKHSGTLSLMNPKQDPPQPSTPQMTSRIPKSQNSRTKIGDLTIASSTSLEIYLRHSKTNDDLVIISGLLSQISYVKLHSKTAQPGNIQQ